MSSHQQSAFGGGVDELVIFRCVRGQELKFSYGVSFVVTRPSSYECPDILGQIAKYAVAGWAAGDLAAPLKQALVTAGPKKIIRRFGKSETWKFPPGYFSYAFNGRFLEHLERSGAIERLELVEQIPYS
jgi:hypothetical protein